MSEEEAEEEAEEELEEKEEDVAWRTPESGFRRFRRSRPVGTAPATRVHG